MISRYEAYVDGIALSSIDPSICVLDIRPGDVTPQLTLKEVAGRNGAIIAKEKFSKATVEVDFEIHEYDVGKRNMICQKVQRWANGKILKTSDRPGQLLHSVCEKYPVVTARDWTSPVSVVFSGYAPPFWEDENAVTVALSGTSGTTQKFVPGSAENTLVKAVLTAGASISSFSVTVDGKTLSFSGLSLSSGDVVTIDYDDYLFLRIRKGNSSIMNKRSGSSADELRATCGKINTFSFTSSGNASVTFTAKGWWL